MTDPGQPRVSRESVNLAAHNLVRRAARRLGFDLVRADFNSPLVDVATLPEWAAEEPEPMPGVELDLDAQLAFLQSELGGFMAEFRPPREAQGDPPGFFLENRWYGPMDAEILYAMVRHLRPVRVLELGSGYSTLVIHQALRRNAMDGHSAEHRVADPYPSPQLGALGGDIVLTPRSATDIGQGSFADLGPGDVLFIDTSHVVRPGGEVLQLVLQVLPALAAGVHIHFHDIFRPYGYPRVLYERYNVHWQEQYLVQAFLAYNLNFTVLCANHALWRQRRAQVSELFPALRVPMQPSAFWLRREDSERLSSPGC